eukprot:242626-Chlamydomonas_euryale.AAC.1
MSRFSPSFPHPPCSGRSFPPQLFASRAQTSPSASPLPSWDSHSHLSVLLPVPRFSPPFPHPPCSGRSFPPQVVPCRSQILSSLTPLLSRGGHSHLRLSLAVPRFSPPLPLSFLGAVIPTSGCPLPCQDSPLPSPHPFSGRSFSPQVVPCHAPMLPSLSPPSHLVRWSFPPQVVLCSAVVSYIPVGVISRVREANKRWRLNEDHV